MRIALLIPCALLVVAASAQVRPAKQNPSYNPTPKSSLFDSFNTGANIKILSASIAKDGTITTQFTITDSAGAGLDINGILTPGVEALAFVAAYIPERPIPIRGVYDRNGRCDHQQQSVAAAGQHG